MSDLCFFLIFLVFHVHVHLFVLYQKTYATKSEYIEIDSRHKSSDSSCRNDLSNIIELHLTLFDNIAFCLTDVTSVKFFLQLNQDDLIIYLYYGI